MSKHDSKKLDFLYNLILNQPEITFIKKEF